MEAEAGAIIGVANLMIKKQLTNYTVSLSNSSDAQLYFPCYHLDTKKFNLAVVPGFIDATLFQAQPGTECLNELKLVDNIFPVSSGFYEAEQKNMKKYKMRQEI
jgi:hypothetical protein